MTASVTYHRAADIDTFGRLLLFRSAPSYPAILLSPTAA